MTDKQTIPQLRLRQKHVELIKVQARQAAEFFDQQYKHARRELHDIERDIRKAARDSNTQSPRGTP